MAVSFLHIAAQIEAPGGMGSIIRRHRKQEPQSAFVGLFDRPRKLGLGVASHLGGRAWTTPRGLRVHFQAAMAMHPSSDVAVYHNAWGVAWFASLDGCSRRVAMLHTDGPDFDATVQALRGQLDGVICLSTAMQQVCLDKLPELTVERCQVLSCPLVEPTVAALLDRGAGRPLRLGYAGRLDQKQKRLDRVAPFLAQLDVLGVDWRFEFLGDGPMRARLMKQLASDGRVTFLGWREGDEYWRAMAQWDAIIFFSDFEASPLALHEAMALGVLPFFPRLGRTQGEVDAAWVDPRGVYPAGDVRAAAQQLVSVLNEPADYVSQLRKKSLDLVRPRFGQSYEQSFHAWIRIIMDLPRVSNSGSRKSHFSDQLPIGLLAKIWPQALRR